MEYFLVLIVFVGVVVRKFGGRRHVRPTRRIDRPTEVMRRSTQPNNTRATVSVPNRPASTQPLPPRPVQRIEEHEKMAVFSGRCSVIDGDTIIVNKQRIRLFGIDAPEMEHPWGNKSKWTLIGLCKGRDITIHPMSHLSYGRIVAKCILPDGRDLSEEMVRRGMALDWPEFSGGVYLKFEPEGVRKRHWRADARQNGRHDIWATPYSGTKGGDQGPRVYQARRRQR